MGATSLHAITLSLRLGAPVGPDQRPIYGWKDAKAYARNGLAVHADPGHRPRWKWTVTQVSSGLKIECLGGRTKAEAAANMLRALDLPFDWTQGEAATVAAMKKDPEIGKALRKIGERN